jgi:cytochrome-b5 reductase
MLQIMQTILSNRADKTKISLVFANIEEKDILLKDFLDVMAMKHQDRVQIYYVLDK